MYNLMKFEFYKLKKSKVFKNSFIVIGCFIIASIAIFYNYVGNIYIMDNHLGGRDFGFLINKFIDKSHPKALEFFYSAAGFMPVIEILVLSIVSTLVINEYTNGTIKNILAYGNKRLYVYISKLFIISVAILILITFLLFGSVLIGVIVKGVERTFSFSIIFYMIRFTLLLWIILTSMASIYMCLATVTRSKSIVVGTGITLIFVFCLIMPLLYAKLKSYPNYTPTYMLMNVCSASPSAAITYQMIITCIISIIVTTVLGGFIFENQDIK